MDQPDDLAFPYADVLYPLSSSEMVALRTRIEVEGPLDPLLATADHRLLDGHNRLKITHPWPPGVTVVPGSAGWSDAECRAYIYRCNNGRRNLAPEHKKELVRKMKVTARELREQDPHRFTQEVLARMFGVAQQTVSDWLMRNTESGKTHNPTVLLDARVKINPGYKKVILERVQSGETQAAVAVDCGINQSQVSRIVAAELREQEKKADAAAVLQNIDPSTLGVIDGDFREKGHVIADASVQLVLADPPYGAAAMELYGNLAEFASRILVPGGLCFAYTGQTCLPDVLRLMGSHLEYVWTFAQINAGPDLRCHKWKLRNGWKPVVCFGKPPIPAWWNWTRDVVAGSREKDTHEWQQAEAEAVYILENFSLPDGIVCDPFCGGGTTGVAAKKLGRKFVSFEINAESAERARARLAQATHGGGPWR